MTSVKRYGYHAQPTSLVLAFSEPLDPSLAQNGNEYEIVPVIEHGREHVVAGPPDPRESGRVRSFE